MFDWLLAFIMACGLLAAILMLVRLGVWVLL